MFVSVGVIPSHKQNKRSVFYPHQLVNMLTIGSDDNDLGIALSVRHLRVESERADDLDIEAGRPTLAREGRG